MPPDWASLVISAIAFVVSVISLFLQYRVRGAKIAILNAGKPQQTSVQRHDKLPEHVQKKFPYSYFEWAGCAWVDIVFGNAGDRAGLAIITKVEVKNDRGIFRATFDNYTVIPAYEIVNSGVLLRNIPLAVGAPDMPIEIIVSLEWGGYKPTSGKYVSRASIEETFRITISAPNSPDPTGLIG